MIEESVIEELKAKFGEVVVLAAGEHEVAVRCPSRAIWKKFRTLMADPVKRPDAYEHLFLDCAVHPEKMAVMAMLDRKPALAENFGMEVAGLAGAALEVEKNG